MKTREQALDNPDNESKCALFEFCENRSVHGLNGLCQDCFDNCDHDEIECGNCQDCGQHISDFMDEDYGKDR